MTPQTHSHRHAAHQRRRAWLPFNTLVGFGLAVAAIVLIALVSYRSQVESAAATAKLAETLEVAEQLEAVLSTLKDAETGQRGFLLTGQESHLEPFNDARSALMSEFRTLRALTTDNPRRQRQLDALQVLAIDKLDELMETIVARRAGDMDAALKNARSGRGKATMDRLRAELAVLKNEERLLLATRQAAQRDATRWAYLANGGGLALLLVLVAIAATLAARDHRDEITEAWLRAGLAEFRVRLQGDQPLDELGRNALEFLCQYLDAPVGALYIAEPASGGLRRFASHALPTDNLPPVVRGANDLVGQAAQQKRLLHVREVPENYLPVRSALGGSAPVEVVISPAAVDGAVFAVVELGFFHAVDAADRELLERVAETLGVAVRSAKDRSQLEELLAETQRQAEELQTQQEELRVSNEELEEQSRALKDSQARMETQQAELEQINSQLEEQTQLLEHQKDELATSQAVLTDKAAELLRSNQYKSEFLANMSHELRTPLNSTLILAKLLADNAPGNLSDEQVKYAQTISSAGNDLLALINDILDLSKIEAGKIEVANETVSVQATIDALRRTFDPLVRQKGLALGIAIDPDAPQRIESDGQRLGQILKNLLSNAAKFTERGRIDVRVFTPQPGQVAFAVRDTGIGIAAHQREIIFEAFRQADGSTHRKFGGTGLGLSISLNLARLLGGDITVESAPGEGSLFTLTLPLAPTEPSAPAPHAPPPIATFATPAAPRAAQAVRAVPAAGPTAVSALAQGPLEDDRDRLTPGTQTLLVIEDDLRFAAILRDLAREQGFLCVLAHSANDGLAAARTLQPSAITLDMMLPDHSGLGVLDQLKRDARTRHIPVHIASVEDYRREAFELGAVGYAIKPVQREQLVEAMQRLQAKFSAGRKRVLVVEDDARQRESMRLLLAHGDVQITDVDNAMDALAQLKTTTFDCMVMDLNLPDLSGYELLERMASEHDLAFPPVIVYTGRQLTRDEEQQLRRHSQSIIVKDARSPERLLDEVTLFLHQVESVLPAETQRLLKVSRARDTALEGRRILIVEDDVRNIFALSSVLETKGAAVQIARNGLEALDALERATGASDAPAIDMVLMDIMMPEMDGFTAMREIRKRPAWKKLPIIALTAKAMRDDQEQCMAAGANDYIAKPLDVDKLLSLVRVWMPK